MMKRSVAIFAAAIAMVCGATIRCGAQATDAHEVGAPASAAISVPRLVQFNGSLKDIGARPVSGVASVTFAIYAEQDGGSALWSETQNVLADSNGHFNALLGAATSGGFPSELFTTGQSRWLGITLARSPEMPRVMLASVPYAMKAGDADTLGGLPASSYVTAQQLAARNTAPIVAVPNTTIIASPFAPVPAGAASAPGGDTAQVLGGGSVTQATVTGTGTADYLPLWTSGTNLGVSKIYQANGGFVGINTNTPLLQLDVNGNSIFRGSFQMAPQGTATASAGQPSHSFQWQGSVFNSSTKEAVNEAFGFRTVPDQNNVPAPTTKLDLFYGPGGGTLNDLGLSINHSGLITFVPSQTFNGGAASLTSISLPNSSGSTVGTITIGGDQFLADYGDVSNTFVGGESGTAHTATGVQNTALGYYSLDFVTSGGYNTALGGFAMFQMKTGSGNVAVGASALSAAAGASGSNNVAVGASALEFIATGNDNIAIGASAGPSMTKTTNVTVIGAGADAADGLTNATAIGAGATVTESNAVVLGTTGGGAPGVGIGTSAPNHTLDVVDRGVNGSGIFASSTVSGDSAIYGSSTATSGHGSNGGLFQSLSPAGSGVVGINDSGGIGGYFEGISGTAGYFLGNVTVTGTLTKGGGSFKIDDPIDPANKYLSHSFVESPDMMNIYNGNVTTDAKGYATVTMPDWFEALNRDFRYQLTTINSFSRATVSAELKDGQFRIRTSQPHVKVSWQVTGIRHDAWANAHRIPNEETKPGDEHGKYLHPELFGAGPDKQIGTQPRPAATPVNATAAPPSAETSGRR